MILILGGIERKIQKVMKFHLKRLILEFQNLI